jgi:hypothetical protein
MRLMGRTAASGFVSVGIAVMIAVAAGCGGTSGTGRLGASPARPVPTSSTGVIRATGSATSSPAARSSPTDTIVPPHDGSTQSVIYFEACQAIQGAWSKFQNDYASASSLPEKNLVAAKAALAVAVANGDVSKKLLVDTSWQQQAVLSLTTDALTFSNDFTPVEDDLQAGSADAAESVISGKLQSDLRAIDVDCGTS